MENLSDRTMLALRSERLRPAQFRSGGWDLLAEVVYS